MKVGIGNKKVEVKQLCSNVGVGLCAGKIRYKTRLDLDAKSIDKN
jgi:hypothetical protein